MEGGNWALARRRPQKWPERYIVRQRRSSALWSYPDFQRISLAGPRSETASGTAMTGVERFYCSAIPAAGRKWAGRLARIPWTTEDYTKHLKRKHRDRKRAVIGLLAAPGSVAGTIYCGPRLTRDKTKEAPRMMQKQRKRQEVSANVLFATRFKHFTQTGGIIPVARMTKCGRAGTLAHLLECNELRIPAGDRG